MPPDLFPPTCSFHFESALASAGCSHIAGVDEAGRGPLAGPVVAAAVVFPSEWFSRGLPPGWEGLNDSKALSPARREAFFLRLRETDQVSCGHSIVEADEIDRCNILRASEAAMMRALQTLPAPPHHVLVDGLRVTALPYPQTPIVKGDSLSFSIAAASIIAKVTRDRLMVEYDQRWPGYGFAQHKGYPTPSHRRALERLGPCPIHRRSFSPVALAQGDLFKP